MQDSRHGGFGALYRCFIALQRKARGGRSLEVLSAVFDISSTQFFKKYSQGGSPASKHSPAEIWLRIPNFGDVPEVGITCRC